VAAWFEATPGTALHVSVLTLGELRKGVEALRDRARQERLRVWLEIELPQWFDTRVLPIDLAVAERWGRLLAAAGRPLPAVDSLLAATALDRGLRLVTRNVRDFEGLGLEIVDPWEA
jgi:toxin FitB